MAFINRVVEYPNRYLLEDEHGVQTGPYTLIRDEGTVTEAGTPVNALNLNSIIADAVSLAMAAFTIDSNNNVSYKNLQTGKTTTTITARTAKTVTVTFPQAFDTIPTVVATPLSTNATQLHATVSGISTTGFTINLYSTIARTCNVNWIALAQ